MSRSFKTSSVVGCIGYSSTKTASSGEELKSTG